MHPHPDLVLPHLESGFGRAPVLVVGDTMLDRSLRGRVGRISPEAPVPVVHLQEERCTPGGAGNVACNLAGLGCAVRLVGAVGMDADGERLRARCRDHGLDASGLVAVAARPTVTKTRIIGGHQQMLRLDVEDAAPLTGLACARLRAAALERVDGVAAVVISDYAKGVVGDRLCRELIDAARARRIPVLVDPKSRDFARYAGATAITPNRAELAAVASTPLRCFADEVAVARRLIADLGLDFMVLTLSEEGIARIGGGDVLHIPALAREVFDVSGAGDTVIATLAAGLAAGLPVDDAVRLANVAAGVVVGKVGTVPIAAGELLAAVLASAEFQGASKICPLPQLLRRAAVWRARGERVVFANGCFDLLHCGHVRHLAQAREFGDRLVVGLNSDASVRRLKGAQRPFNAEAQRAEVLAALAAVDAVVVFEEDTPLALISALRPQVLVKGADYSEEQVAGAREVRSWGGRVELVPLVEGLSTTRLAQRTAGARG